MAAGFRAGASSDAYVGLGSNLGDRVGELDRAFDALAALPATSLVGRSAYYLSAPVDAPGNDYCNAVARLRTKLTPLALLHALQAIELRHGRTRSFANAPRTLDLDLLMHDDAVITSAELTLPHPRMHLRAFVLEPLAEIAPIDLVVPGRGPVSALRAAAAGQRVAKLDR